MRANDLKSLVDVVPQGDWKIEQAEEAGLRRVVSTERNGRTVLAQGLTPEMASFIVTAKGALPELLQELEEEKAHLQFLQLQYAELLKTAKDLGFELEKHQVELYEVGEFSLVLPEAIPQHYSVQASHVDFPL